MKVAATTALCFLALSSCRTVTQSRPVPNDPPIGQRVYVAYGGNSSAAGTLLSWDEHWVRLVDGENGWLIPCENVVFVKVVGSEPGN